MWCFLFCGFDQVRNYNAVLCIYLNGTVFWGVAGYTSLPQVTEHHVLQAGTEKYSVLDTFAALPPIF